MACAWASLLAPPPSPVHFQKSPPPPLCTTFHFCCLLGFFFAVWRSVCPRGSASLSQGWLRDTSWHLVFTCLVCQRSPKHVWSWQTMAAAAGLAACLFSQCHGVEKPSIARVSGCQWFNSPWCFTSTKHGSNISAMSLIHGAYTVCICVPVTILDLLSYIILRVWPDSWLSYLFLQLQASVIFSRVK
jgi:hypothetical protein